ncbi:XRE family transcriptional regulator [Mycobacteroides abscessus]|uniref:ImmA/IrrE family metallo-endopeptidase n=1 Tax=Mycobacteroides abscessus TaxID=36809 RepID=UPI000C259DED
MNEQQLPPLAPNLGDYPTGNPVMVRLHRVARGWPMRQLAQEAKVSAGHVSRVESGSLALSHYLLRSYADALQCPQEALCVAYDPSPALGVHRYRNVASAEWKRDQIWAQANLVAMRLGRLTAYADITPALAIPGLDPADYCAEHGEIGVAQTLRDRWRVSGPIGSVVELLEAAGIFVVVADFGASDLQSVTLRASAHHPHLMYVNARLTVNRMREVMAHELGHLVMDSGPTVSRNEIEQRATEFSHEFLAPIDDIGIALERVNSRTVHELDELSMTWGVSAATLVTRAGDRGILSAYQRRSLFRFLNETGRAGTQVSAGSARETPRLVAAVLERLAAADYTGAQFDEITLLDVCERSAVFGLRHTAPVPKGLVVVPDLSDRA